MANARPCLIWYTRCVSNEEALFRRRLREIVIQKYGSLDRFYLETDFSKGHLSQILRGKRSPSLATVIKLARALDVQVADFFRPTDKRVAVCFTNLWCYQCQSFRIRLTNSLGH
jgi:transcriptional regulator with XRE-family HTH domain